MPPARPDYLVDGPGMGQQVRVLPPLRRCRGERQREMVGLLATAAVLGCGICGRCMQRAASSSLTHVAQHQHTPGRPLALNNPPASPPLGAPSQVRADPTILVRVPSLEVSASVQCMNCGHTMADGQGLRTIEGVDGRQITETADQRPLWMSAEAASGASCSWWMACK